MHFAGARLHGFLVLSKPSKAFPELNETSIATTAGGSRATKENEELSFEGRAAINCARISWNVEQECQ